jgi:hypothetical protein
MVKEKVKLLTEILRYEPENTSVVRFTRFGTPQIGYGGPPPPTQKNVEDRLRDVLERDYTIPVEGEYWETVTQFLSSVGPTYKGEFRRDTLERFGICKSSRQIIKIYADGMFFPTKTDLIQ